MIKINVLVLYFFHTYDFCFLRSKTFEKDQTQEIRFSLGGFFSEGWFPLFCSFKIIFFQFGNLFIDLYVCTLNSIVLKWES